MKYMVVVNRKYIVAVEANSACSAEHKILDTMDGVQGAQAFTGKELSTDTFQWYFENGLTVSYDEIVKIFAKYTEACTELGKRIEEEADKKLEVERLKEQLRKAEEDLNRSNWNTKQAKLNLIEVKREINLKD